MDKEGAFEIIGRYLLLLKSVGVKVEEAYVFGSYARGNFNENSDIDLALVIFNLNDRFAMQTELLKLGRDFGYIIEPHPFNLKEFNHLNPLTHEILTTGVRVA